MIFYGPYHSDCDAGESEGSGFRCGHDLYRCAAWKEMVRLLKEGVGPEDEHNHISSFRAFYSALLPVLVLVICAGIAIAIVSGGPGRFSGCGSSRHFGVRLEL